MPLKVLIGRFQIIHAGHLEIMFDALEHDMYHKDPAQLIILIGSAYKAPDFKNPFSFEERRELILNAFYEYCNDHDIEQPWLLANRIKFEPIIDHPYSDEKWLAQIHSVINKYNDKDITLIGAKSDESSYYLDLFPQWKSEVFEGQLNCGFHATDIRSALYENKLGIWLNENEKDDEKIIMNSTYFWLINYWLVSKQGKNIIKEYEAIKKYKEAAKAYPYPPIYSTVDGVCLYKGHILMIKRKSYPGKDLWALPGGFINQDETLQQAVIREVLEETNLNIDKTLIKAKEIFDAPNRSLRGRTITTGFLFQLPDYWDIKNIKAADDAADWAWIPLGKITSREMRSQIFEDHVDIITTLIGKADL